MRRVIISISFLVLLGACGGGWFEMPEAGAPAGPDTIFDESEAPPPPDPTTVDDELDKDLVLPPPVSATNQIDYPVNDREVPETEQPEEESRIPNLPTAIRVGPQERVPDPLPDDPLHFYISTQGNDAWSGQFADPVPSRRDGPFATIQKARDHIRALQARGTLKNAVVVHIRGGTYRLGETLQFSPQDSGTAETPIIYQTYQNETVIISGGRTISNWRPSRAGRQIYETTLSATDAALFAGVNSIFVNDRRAVRARFPNQGSYFLMASEELARSTLENQSSNPLDHTSFLFRTGDISGNWTNLRDVEVVALKAWEQTRHRIDQVRGNRVHLQGMMGRPVHYSGFHGRYFVDNVLEGLDSPGEWYYNRQTRKLYYWPLPEETIGSSEIVIPMLTQLVKLTGTRHLIFRGLVFAHTGWRMVDAGHPGCQAAVCLATPPAIEFDQTDTIQFLDNHLLHIGGNAVGGPTRNSIIRGNEMEDIGAGGIRIGKIVDRSWIHDTVEGPLGWIETEFLCEMNEITDNTIHDIGKVYFESVGIQDLLSRGTKISHNLIYDLPYSGISVGWIWNAQPTRAGNNQIESNHIHHVGQILTDLGGIYTLGRQSGSVIRGNLVHDILFTPHHYHRTSLMGIYLDQGSNGFAVSENIVHRTASASFHINRGSFNTIENNTFIEGSAEEDLTHDYGQIGFASPLCAFDPGLSDEPGLYRHPIRGSCPENVRGQAPPQGNIFRHNIIYGSPPEAGRKLIHYSHWPFDFVQSDFNLFYRPQSSGTPGNLWQWQEEMGQDQNSMNANPLFEDVLEGDFRLKSDSPASQVGFSPFTLVSAQ